MDHGYFQDRLSAYHDRSLTPEEMRMVEEHVAACAACLRQLEMLAKLDRLIDEKADLAESDYWETAAQKTEQRLGFKKESKVTTIRRSWTGLGWKLAAAAASVAALTFIALHEGDILDSTDKRMQDSPAVSAPVMRDMAVTHGADSTDRHVYHDLAPMPEEEDVRTEFPEAEKPEPAVAGQGAMKDDLVLKKETIAEDMRGKLDPALDAEREPGSEPTPAPVETVDELLEQVAGAVTNASGEIFVRGGRAGEVDYIVDSIPGEIKKQGDTMVSLATPGETKEQTRDLGQTISVTAQRDIIERFEVSNQISVTHESLETTDDTRSLDHWRLVRDSLQPQISTQLRKRQHSVEKSMQYTAQPAEAPPSPAPADSTSTQPTHLERYLEACYQIALQTDDESEYNEAVVVLTEYAERQDSPSQKLARRYLKLLEDLEK